MDSETDPEQKGKKRRSTSALLGRLLALARPEWRSLAVGTVFLLLGSAMGLAYPQAIRVIIDEALGSRDLSRIDLAAGVMFVIFAVQGVSIAVRAYLFTVAGERVVARLRENVYAHVLAQEVAFFDSRRTGELISRLASDTAVLQSTVSVNISMALRHVATVIGGLGLLLYTSPRLTLIMLAVVPPVAIGAVRVGRRIREFSRQVQDALARAGEVAEETLSGVRTVRAFGQEPHEVGRYSAAVQTSFELARQRTLMSSIFLGVASFAGYAAIVAVLWYGGRMVVGGEMSVGDLTSFVLYTLLVALGLGALGGLWSDFMRAAGSGERIFGLLDRPPAMPSGEGDRPDRAEGRIQFDAVDFSYPTRPDVPVLRGMDVAIAPGEIVALVGSSGAGKSTVASLLTRLYDPDGGVVRLDGRDIRDLDPDWLRDRIGVVAQEPILFSTSIADNIRYGRRKATDEEVREAARVANAHDFIEMFPDGFATEVGERGVQLSGGQKQRVAIARAVLKNPRILLLDEATSALDSESEHLVKEALDRLMKDRTTLIIAHRLSTVKDVDRVLVLDGGQIAQAGSHDTLMAEGGLYRRLVERQLAA